MRLLQVDTLAEARAKIAAAMQSLELKTETIPSDAALGRVLAEDVCSPEQIPTFPRSSVDGYAVCSKDTAGASESIPVFLDIIEEVQIGYPAKKTVVPGTCTYVPTGGMIPQGADAMVMVEYCELFDETSVAVYDSVSYGRSIVLPGEDVRQGDILMKKGTRIGAAQIGALAAAGILEVPVFVPWRVAVLSTGDELIPPEKSVQPGQVRDINSHSIAAMARQCGLMVTAEILLPDDESLFENTVRSLLPDNDLILTSGGSSQGKKDMTEEILSRVSNGGIFTHGLALKPGKPTILGFDKATNTLLCGLPGHPVAALTVFELLLSWLWRHETSQKEPVMATAQMRTNLASAAGKTTCLPVRLEWEDGILYADPILGKSGLITTMSEADGYVLIDMNQEGLQKNEAVAVYRWM